MCKEAKLLGLPNFIKFLTPDIAECWHLHSVGEHPREDDHQRNVMLAINPRIPAMVRYHYVSVKGTNMKLIN